MVTLLIDGVEYEMSVTEGDLEWSVNTGHFSNGAHTIVARAADNFGIAYLGGNPGANVVANEVLSTPVTLYFSNIVRWIEPESVVEGTVPISIRSDVFPTNWTVFVEDESRTVVRTFAGNTSDGVIETFWDWTDNLGQPVPSEAAYRVLFTLGDTMPDSGGGGGGGGEPSPPPAPLSVSYNEFGVPEYEIAVALPPLPPILFDEAVREKIARGLLPPLPPVSPRYSTKNGEPAAAMMKKKRVLPQSRRVSSGAAMAAGLPPSGPPVWNDEIVWMELPWTSGEIILARQKFLGGIGTMNAVYGQNLATLASDIANAALFGEGLSGRTVYSQNPVLCDSPDDYDTLLNNLTLLEVRDFYYIGHSSGQGIGYSEGSPTNGITTSRLQSALRNFIRRSPQWDNRWVYTFRKPFRFVFIDGCQSSRGTFKNAFGIVPDNDHTRLGKKWRSYLGWNATTKDSIINNNQSIWSARFWKEWVNVEQDIYDVWLQTVIANTTAAVAIPENPIITGYRRLTWAD